MCEVVVVACIKYAEKSAKAGDGVQGIFIGGF